MSWKPQEDFCIRFKDKTAETRTVEELEEMVRKINEIANEYDFGVSMFSGIDSFSLALKEEKELIESYNDVVMFYKDDHSSLGELRNTIVGEVRETLLHDGFNDLIKEDN